MRDQAIEFLSLLTLISGIFFVIFVLLIVYVYYTKNESAKKIIDYFKSRSRYFSVIIAFTATAGSLFFSEVAKMEPCKMCWLQRIFMYPLVFILITGIAKKIKQLETIVLPLSITGLILAAYHYYLQNTANPLAPCSTVGFSLSCSERYLTHYGYITIPMMSLTAFALITLFMLLSKKS